jgi:hypothetical protein
MLVLAAGLSGEPRCLVQLRIRWPDNRGDLGSPATVLSSAFSWGAYLAASLALAMVLGPTANAVLSGSQLSAGSKLLDGVKDVIDGLSPGLNTTLQFGLPGLQGRIETSGHTVSYSSAAFSGSEQTRWALPNMTLEPGVSYVLRLEGESVMVSRVG